jgi:protein-S-isoprenylcysteine O-methyltransferase Ste14
MERVSDESPPPEPSDAKAIPARPLEQTVRAIEQSAVLFHLMNLAVASVWVWKVYSGWTPAVDALGKWDVQSIARVILMFNLLLLVVFYVLRRRATDAASDLVSIAWAHVGTWIPLLFGTVVPGDRPADQVVLTWLKPYVDTVMPEAVHLVFGQPLLTWLCLAVMMVAAAVSTLGFVSLGRSWGIIPANRGIKTGGLYRIVRHPIYSSYIFLDVAYILVAFTWVNLVILFGAVLSLYMRTIYEERVLVKDPEYASYAQKTRWKLVPFVV